MMHQDKVAVLMPVYNESAHLGEVISSILKLNEKFHLLVVDDGSTDGSGDIARQLGAELIQEKTNHGKGYSLRTGFEHLIRRGFKWIIIMDSDGQHLTKDMQGFLEKAQSGDYGIINGSRLKAPHKMPLLRLWANYLMSWTVSLVAHQRIEDAQCGFKMLSAEFLKRARLKSDRFEIEDEIILEAVRLGYSIASVPVTSAYAEEKSHIHPLNDTLRFMRFILSRIGQ